MARLLDSSGLTLLVVCLLCLATIVALVLLSVYDTQSDRHSVVLVGFAGMAATNLFTLLKQYQTDERNKEHQTDAWMRQAAILKNQQVLMEHLKVPAAPVPPEAMRPPEGDKP